MIPHPGRAVCGDDAAVRAGSVPVVEEGRQAYEQVEACENLVMDPESAAFQPRDDFWQMQDDMLRMHQTQAELADRVSRLERRNEDDTRLKNVWGGTSPFPSVLGGTPQQGAMSIAVPCHVWTLYCDPWLDRPQSACPDLVRDRMIPWSPVLMCYSSPTAAHCRQIQHLRRPLECFDQ